MANAGGRPRRTLVVGLVITAGALFGVARLYGEWRRADASAAWPETAGKIEASSLTEHERVGSGHRTFTVHLRYGYVAGGKPQQGSAIHLGGFPSYDTESEARAVQARYPEGATVTVFYDPAAPDHAVLEAGHAAAASSLGLGALLIGLVLALGVTVVVQSFLRIRHLRP